VTSSVYFDISDFSLFWRALTKIRRLCIDLVPHW